MRTQYYSCMAKAVGRIFCFLLLALGSGTVVNAENALPEVAFVTFVQGEVTYVREAAQPIPLPVIPFMKVRQSAIITVPAESQIHLLFLQQGIQEIWQGERVLKVENSGCLVKTTDDTWEEQIPHAVQTLLFQPQKTMQESPFLLFAPDALPNTRAFAVLRELPEKKSSEMQQTYAALQEQFGSQDVIPELYLLSVLVKHGQFARMQIIIQSQIEKFPENAILLEWQKWVQARVDSLRE